MEIVRQLKKALIQDEMEKVLNFLSFMLLDQDTLDEVTNLRGQLHSLESNKRKGLLDPRDSLRIENTLRDSTLQLTNKLLGKSDIHILQENLKLLIEQKKQKTALSLLLLVTKQNNQEAISAFQTLLSHYNTPVSPERHTKKKDITETHTLEQLPNFIADLTSQQLKSSWENSFVRFYTDTAEDSALSSDEISTIGSVEDTQPENITLRQKKVKPSYLRSESQTKLILQKMKKDEPIKRIEQLLSIEDFFWKKANFRPPNDWNVSYTHCYLLEQRTALKGLRLELDTLNNRSKRYPDNVEEKIKKVAGRKEQLKKLLEDSYNKGCELFSKLMFLEDKIEQTQEIFYSTESENNAYIKNNGVLRLNHAIEELENALFRIGKVAFDYVNN